MLIRKGKETWSNRRQPPLCTIEPPVADWAACKASPWHLRGHQEEEDVTVNLLSTSAVLKAGPAHSNSTRARAGSGLSPPNKPGATSNRGLSVPGLGCHQNQHFLQCWRRCSSAWDIQPMGLQMPPLCVLWGMKGCHPKRYTECGCDSPKRKNGQNSSKGKASTSGGRAAVGRGKSADQAAS